jgi:hypothetical protein
LGEYDGNFTYFKNLFAPVSVEDKPSELTENFYLDQNYPNPFNPSTRIKYQISNISNVSLKVFDVLGNEVEILVDEERGAGHYEVDFDASGLSSGVYFYKLITDSFAAAKKMLLLR